MKKIVIKEIDRLTSKKFKNKQVSEYLIYITIDDTLVSAYTVYGEEAKKELVNDLLVDNFTIDEMFKKDNVILETKM